MKTFQIRPLSEDDIFAIVHACGGTRAHPDADRRSKRSADFVVGDALIELKLLEDEGLQKHERQRRLAELFDDEGARSPVVVLDRSNLSAAGQRRFDRSVEGPIKSAVASARQQLKQSRSEKPSTSLSILWLVNNGYTALAHEEITELVVRRARNDSKTIDGVIVSGCYFHSDGFDNFFMWPYTYVPILRDFRHASGLQTAWQSFANAFMTEMMRGWIDPDTLRKGPIIDTCFNVGSVTYVRPAPPIGTPSEYFEHGRPRANSTGLQTCPPVALTFPGLSQSEWQKFRNALPRESGLLDTYELWLEHESQARKRSTTLKPFVRVPMSFSSWRKSRPRNSAPTMRSIHEEAAKVFDERVKEMIAKASECDLVGDPPRPPFVLAVTDEIGQDRANDLSHIVAVTGRGIGESRIVCSNLRIFHEHAVALGSANALSEGIDTVFWQLNRTYAWV